jgi:hypothetical protein
MLLMFGHGVTIYLMLRMWRLREGNLPMAELYLQLHVQSLVFDSHAWEGHTCATPHWAF